MGWEIGSVEKSHQHTCNEEWWEKKTKHTLIEKSKNSIISIASSKKYKKSRDENWVDSV